MGVSPFQVVRDFEAELCRYTGAPFAVAVNSCTMALLLAVAWHLGRTHYSTQVEIPKRTYISVPMSIIHAGGHPTFRDEEWQGWYRLKPLLVWDSARYFSQDMYRTITCFDPTTFTTGGMVCCSFHASKTLGHTQGGAILHDSSEADVWFRKCRFDGRTEGVAPIDDTFTDVGYHCYLSPDVAAALLLKLHSLPRHNAPLLNDDYPRLDQMEIFR